MKKRFCLFALALGAMALGLNFAYSEKLESSQIKDTTFILELNNDYLGDNEATMRNQNQVLSTLRSKFGFDFKYVRNYTNAINAIEVNANSSYEVKFAEVEGINRVYINREYHFGEDTSTTLDSLNEAGNTGDITYSTDGSSTLGIKSKAPSVKKVFSDPTGDNLINLSAENMNSPTDYGVGTNGGEKTIIAILDASFAINHEWFQDLSDSQVRYTKAEMAAKVSDPAHKLNLAIKGGAAQGTLGSTYKNNKIPFYYDYGGDSDHNYKDDYDVLSKWDEHGTHVASIAAANGVYKGIAPNAQLALMKVFRESISENNGIVSGGVGATDADILQALEDCQALGVDCVNMSLGSDLDDFLDRSASMSAFKNLKEMGCSVNVSAGNDGKSLYKTMGPYADWSTDSVETGIIGSYANDNSSMIIGSTNLEKNHYDDALIVTYTEKDGTTGTRPVAYADEAKSNASQTKTPDELKLNTLAALGLSEIPFVRIPEYGTNADYTKALGAYNSYHGYTPGSPDYLGGFSGNNYIAVVDRGSTSFSDKAQAAYDNGCIALIVINNDPTAIEFNFGMAWGDSTGYNFPKIPVVFALYRDRQYFSSEPDGTGTVRLAQDTIEENPDKNKMSDYSSNGATFDLSLNPSISAPGASVLGAIPGEQNTTTSEIETFDNKAYAYLSGTSMSAPNYTGATALILGDKTVGMSEEDRKTYAKTIPLRTMSTTTLYSIDNYKITNKETGEQEVTETNFYSPRLQGAGNVNVGKALDTKVYLEGMQVKDDGSFNESKLMGQAKVELKNNEKIKDGKVDVSFMAHSEASTDKTYNATLYVYRPETKEYYNYENHKLDKDGETTPGTDNEFEGYTFSTVNDTQVAKVSKTLTVKANTDTKLNINYDLTADQKKEINDLFKNGTYLEGYVVLEDTSATDKVDLSIPYMGFFGDYKSAEAVEPYDFEKEADRYYPSDIVNYVGKGTNLNLTKMDVSSTIVSMSYSQYEGLAGSNALLYNTGNIKSVSNPITYDKETNTLYAGGDASDVIYIQNFVLRSIKDTAITIKDASGKVVNTTGNTKFLDNVNETTYLYKSHVSAQLINAGIICHHAVATIPLYMQNNRGAKLPDGKYTMSFDYTLAGIDATQTKTYNLILDSKLPEITARKIVTKVVDGKEKQTLRIKYNEIYLTEKNSVGQTNIAVNGGYVDHTITKFEGGYYIDVDVDQLMIDSPEGRVTLDVTDGSGNNRFTMFYLKDIYSGVAIENKDLDLTVTYDTAVTNNNEDKNDKSVLNNTYEITFVDEKGFQSSKLPSGEDFTVILTLDSTYDLSDIHIYSIVGASETEITSYEISDEYTIKFTTNTGNFRIEGVSVEPTPYPGGDTRQGAILGLTFGLVGGAILAAGIVVVVLILLKKKKASAK